MFDLTHIFLLNSFGNGVKRTQTRIIYRFKTAYIADTEEKMQSIATQYRIVAFVWRKPRRVIHELNNGKEFFRNTSKLKVCWMNSIFILNPSSKSYDVGTWECHLRNRILHSQGFIDGYTYVTWIFGRGNIDFLFLFGVVLLILIFPADLRVTYVYFSFAIWFGLSA